MFVVCVEVLLIYHYTLVSISPPGLLLFCITLNAWKQIFITLYKVASLSKTCNLRIAELAERSPIMIQNSSNPSSRKNLDVRPYDGTTAQGATFNMRGQLYRGHANATALFSSPVVSALTSESDDPGSSPGRGKALCPWDVREKKCELRF